MSVKFNQQEILLTEVIMKVAALERLLLKSGTITEVALNQEMSDISKETIAAMQKLKSSDIE